MTGTAAKPATTSGRFARPKSLYIKATGIKDDGTEFSVEMRLDAAHPTESVMTLNMEGLFVDDESNGMYVVAWPTVEHNVKVEFTRCRLGDLTEAQDG